MTTTQSQKSTTKTNNAKATKKPEGKTTEALPIGRFAWLALRSPDLKKSQAFYGEVLGWKFSSQEMGGGNFDVFAGAGGPVCHAETVNGAASFLGYVVVADLAAAAKRVVAAGGTLVGDALALPGIGAMREFVDADGAHLSLFQPENAAAADVVAGPGSVIWQELHAKSVDSALAFLTSVVGYAVDTMPMGAFDYQLLKKAKGDEQSLGGVMPSMNPAAPSSWVPYFHVVDVDAARARATKAGATPLGEAMDVEHVGRMAILLDPLGAVFAVMTPATR